MEPFYSSPALPPLTMVTLWAGPAGAAEAVPGAEAPRAAEAVPGAEAAGAAEAGAMAEAEAAEMTEAGAVAEAEAAGAAGRWMAVSRAVIFFSRFWVRSQHRASTARTAAVMAKPMRIQVRTVSQPW